MPQEMAKAAFGLFCNDEEKMDFREFCTAITICCHGSEEKKASIIFNLFDSNKDGFLPEDGRIGSHSDNFNGASRNGWTAIQQGIVDEMLEKTY